RLRLPSDAHRGEVFGTKEHFRMALEHLCSIFGVILARDREQKAPIPEVEQGPLKRKIGCPRVFDAELQAARAVLSDDPTPQSVNETDGYTLCGSPSDRAEEAQPFAGEREKSLCAVRKPHGEPLAFV